MTDDSEYRLWKRAVLVTRPGLRSETEKEWDAWYEMPVSIALMARNRGCSLAAVRANKRRLERQGKS